MSVDTFDNPYKGPRIDAKRLEGGWLVGQLYDSVITNPDYIETKIGDPTEEDYQAAILQWLIAGFTKSNAVVIGDTMKAHGIGGGRTKRVDSARLALYLTAYDRTATDSEAAMDEAWHMVGTHNAFAKGLVAASDAFWPFADGARLLERAGVRGCVYPTGSVRDNEVFEAFEAANMFVMIPRPKPGDNVTIERAFN